ncbi:MAG TPA: hypothetical protein VG797_02125 [Phycisphaerales bacterium]|nr:hypothetical protein [Phycisphaerales bacterium]
MTNTCVAVPRSRGGLPLVRALVGAALTFAITAGAHAGQVEPAQSVWTLGGSQLQFWDSKASDWLNYTDPLSTVSSSQLLNGIKVFGTGPTDDDADDAAFAITGAQYNPGLGELEQSTRLHITGTAIINGTWDSSTLSIPTTFGVGFGFAGGILDFTATTGFELLDENGDGLQGVGSGADGFGPYEPGGYGVGFQFVDRFNGDATAGRSINWAVDLYFLWTDQGAEDVLLVTIPNNSIDIQVVPAPGAVSAVMLMGLGACSRRRR